MKTQKNKIILILFFILESFIPVGCYFYSYNSLSAPQNLTVDEIGSNYITLSWSKVPNAYSYNVYINTTNDFASSTLAGSVKKNTCQITSAFSMTQYYLWVSAHQGQSSEKENPSLCVKAHTLIGCPEKVSAQLNGSTVTLSWDSVKGATGYRLYKSHSSSTASYAQIWKDVSSDTTSVSDFVSDNNSVYYYWVKSLCNGILSTNHCFASCRIKPLSYSFSKPKNATSGTTSTVTIQDLSGEEVFFTNFNTDSASKYRGAIRNNNTQSVDSSEIPVLDLAKSTSPSRSVHSNAQDSVQFGIKNAKIPEYTRFDSDRKNFSLDDFARSSKNARSLIANSDAISYSVGSKKNFWIQDSNKKFMEQNAILLAESNDCFVWVVTDCYDETSSVDTDNKITTSQAQKVAEQYQKLYGKECAVFGKTYKDGGGKEYESTISRSSTNKINILVFDIDGDYSVIQTSGTFGFFWNKDFFLDEVTSRNSVRSNETEIFYVDCYFLDRFPKEIYSTLAHEMQHMLNYVNKTLSYNCTYSTYFTEMCSLVAEDLFYDINFGESTNRSNGPFARLPLFNYGYYLTGIDEWDSSDNVLYSYANAYAFGAWLARNFGGAELFNKITTNNKNIDLDNIISCIQEMASKNSFAGSVPTNKKQLLEQFARSLCYPDLTNSEFESAKQVSKNDVNNLRPFCAQNTCTVGGYELKFVPIQLSDYYFTQNDTYYCAPNYFFATNNNVIVRPQGISVTSLGAKSGTATFLYSTSIESDFIVK